MEVKVTTREYNDDYFGNVVEYCFDGKQTVIVDAESNLVKDLAFAEDTLEFGQFVGVKFNYYEQIANDVAFDLEKFTRAYASFYHK